MSAIALNTRPTHSEACESLELLLGLWRRVLQTDEVTPESNFFDLGGDSLLALTLFLEIERATGRQLPITAIYDAQTAAEQAVLLEDERQPDFSPLVLLKPGGGGPPLFIFHGIGGTVVEFAELGRLIDISGAVYAVQAQGLDGTLPPLTSVEEMAELYCRAIREKQPKGPYWLCGYSFGGVIALEVARLLKCAGEEIRLVFLIDAYAHPLTWPSVSRFKVRARKIMTKLLASLRSPSRNTMKNVARSLKAQFVRMRKETPAEKLSRKRTWLVNTRPDLPLPLLRTRLAGDKALSRYRPSYYPGNVIFLKARYPDPDFPHDPKRVWRGLFDGMRLHVSPGSHMTIVHKHATSVAACINESLREAHNLAAAADSSAATPSVPSWRRAKIR